MSLKIFTTGGTIDKVYFDDLSEFQVGDPQIGEVLRQAHVSLPYSVTSLFRKDSLELTDEDRATLRAAIEADPARSILVTHGTDTMTVTGKALRGISEKTIVLTGALTPARFRENDAIFNIGFACAVAQTLPEGVYIAMHGRIYDPSRVQKVRAENRFVESEE